MFLEDFCDGAQVGDGFVKVVRSSPRRSSSVWSNLQAPPDAAVDDFVSPGVVVVEAAADGKNQTIGLEITIHLTIL